MAEASTNNRANNRDRRAGIISFSLDGVRYDAKGSFSVGPGYPKRDAIVGSDGIHGFKETPQVPYIEGVITDAGDLDTEKLRQITSATVTVGLNNGKTWLLQNAWYASEGVMTTEEGEVPVRFESSSMAIEI
jgi:hypothetical protein